MGFSDEDIAAIVQATETKEPEPIPGALQVGRLFKIHPFDLGAYFNKGGNIDVFREVDGSLTIHGDRYIQDISVPCLTKEIQ